MRQPIIDSSRCNCCCSCGPPIADADADADAATNADAETDPGARATDEELTLAELSTATGEGGELGAPVVFALATWLDDPLDVTLHPFSGLQMVAATPYNAFKQTNKRTNKQKPTNWDKKNDVENKRSRIRKKTEQNNSKNRTGKHRVINCDKYNAATVTDVMSCPVIYLHVVAAHNASSLHSTSYHLCELARLS